MPRNSAGNYSLPAGNPVVPDTDIEAGWANTTLGDIANEMSNSVDKQGRTAMTGPFKLADGTASAPALTFNGDSNSGIYRVGPDEWALVAGGVEVMRIKNDKISTLLDALEVDGVSFKPTDYARLDGAVFTGGVQFDTDVSLTNRAAFTAMRTATVQQSGTVFIMPEEKFDAFGNYDPTTGKFKAPRAGYYQFSGGVQFQNTTGAPAAIDIAFVRNGSGGSFGDELYGHTFCFCPSTPYNQDGRSTSAVMYLNKDDEVTMENRSQFGTRVLTTTMYVFRGFFSGHFII